MKDLNYQLNDIVEMKKEHPCNNRTKLFQIVIVKIEIHLHKTFYLSVLKMNYKFMIFLYQVKFQ